jgi:hypothetical protein
MKQLMNDWKKYLNEGTSPVNRTQKTKKDIDPPSVRKRKLPFETFPGYDDRNGGLKQLAKGIMEDDEIELLAEPDGDDELNDDELAEIAPALAAAARIASKAGKVASKTSQAADKVGKVAGAVKTASDVAKKVLPDPDKDIDEACIGNPYRNSDGTFSDAGSHVVYTTGYKGDNSSSGCDHGKWKRNKSSTSHKCGRAPNGKKHPYVCKTGKLRENVMQDEQGECYVKLDYLLKLLEVETEAILENDVQAQRQAMAQKCLKMGYTTPQKAFQNLTLTLNNLQKAMKGDLMSEK